MKIKIENADGHPYNTRITDIETGEQIEEIAEIIIHPLVASKPCVEADVSVSLHALSVLAHANIFVDCPHCRARILIDADALPNRREKG